MRKIIYLFVSLTLFCKGGVKKIEIPDVERWMGLYIREYKVGYVYNAVKHTDAGYSFFQRTYMDMKLLGSDENFSSRFSSKTGVDATLKSFEFEIGVRGHKFLGKGKVKGNKLSLEINTSGLVRTKEVKFKPPLIPIVATGAYVFSLKEKKKTRVSVFEPTTMDVADMTIEPLGWENKDISGKRIRLFHIRTNTLGNISEIWVDSSGYSVIELQQPSIKMVMEKKEDAVDLPSESAKLDLLSYFSVKIDTVLNPSQMKYLKIAFYPMLNKSLKLTNAFQHIERHGDTVFIEIKKARVDYLYKKSNPSALAKFVSPDPYIQSDDKRIKSLASKITQGLANKVEKAEAILHWVYQNVRKRPTASMPSAIDVLNTMEGDCNEHTVLYVALARAADIPAKISVGLVYLGGAFYYHAWAQVYLGKWIPVDPTFDEFPANPAHIQLNEGGLKKQAMVLNIVGKIKAKVIKAK